MYKGRLVVRIQVCLRRVGMISDSRKQFRSRLNASRCLKIHGSRSMYGAILSIASLSSAAFLVSFAAQRFGNCRPQFPPKRRSSRRRSPATISRLVRVLRTDVSNGNSHRRPCPIYRLLSLLHRRANFLSGVA